MFSIKFEEYMRRCRCSAKKFSSLTKISEATISRYRSGKTIPTIGSGNIEAISTAIATLLKENKEEIYEDLLVSAYENLEVLDYEVYSKKLAQLFQSLEINKSRIAKEIHFSSSYLSRVCKGDIKPRNPLYIAETIAEYIAQNYNDSIFQNRVYILIYKNVDKRQVYFTSQREYARSIRKWLIGGDYAGSAIVNNLFNNYNEFDKNDYFNYANVNSTIFYKADFRNQSIKSYLGKSGMKEGLFSAIQLACESTFKDDILLYDEICSRLVHKDFRFANEYIHIMERLIKSGKNIKVVHNVDNEPYMVTAKLIGWLPLTMSGKVKHYYASGNQSIYKQLLMSSSNVAYIGTSIEGHLDQEQSFLLMGQDEIMLSKVRGECILDKAEPIFECFDSKHELENACAKFYSGIQDSSDFITFLAAPPLATISESLLKAILDRNNVDEITQENIFAQRKKEKALLKKVIAKTVVHENLDYINAECWNMYPAKLALSNMCTDLDITYTREEYEAHIEETMKFAEENEGYKLQTRHMNFFKNLNIFYCSDNFVLISKITTPAMHFVSTKRCFIEGVKGLICLGAKIREDELTDKGKALSNLLRHITSD